MKKQIKILATALLIAASTWIATPAVRAEDARVGVVDTQQILSQSSLLQVLRSAEADLKSAEQKLYESRNQKLKELETARANMKEDEFLRKKQELERQLLEQVKSEETRLEKRKAEIQKMKIQLEKDVQDIVKAVAQKRKLEIVINKQLVLFGGVDITNEVVEELKKKK
ncbi:hypothetical protein COW36_10330 [bacterium (Candidatus Blackallbacteria) CG17_big_fil_post_rev_8_21_14_2_50_48_46]|uniref:Molecular chaperone Skp n=1 Tax=bacterium (Candidatus Blackallbacteria) CG17_big_fil_post_rev_8_21_14_2_50_48_46 TaxID=2014261 RepID=A0A2M7G525_9BACT|nr:MAG: hypothetical protein COW64_20100 [bacterium (Candidatus Blackallbacteria) CG18_big_fil_WC_8_21_14_2_50_49_26]PIW17030.1 MAG: hypothetical protein COW36_10330 [bacterium (Candidatus Blackallbacteria) CG17_big_fil_post_rev_8_21_14_2_50_48_46]PIW48162.1 MAG: hypothetical protein COW20_10345 [bacterium (Candidatus Blackallbacteria) CG13_big_fil_rev_8_21_14_2_50_49_14]